MRKFCICHSISKVNIKCQISKWNAIFNYLIAESKSILILNAILDLIFSSCKFLFMLHKSQSIHIKLIGCEIHTQSESAHTGDRLMVFNTLHIIVKVQQIACRLQIVFRSAFYLNKWLKIYFIKYSYSQTFWHMSMCIISVCSMHAVNADADADAVACVAILMTLLMCRCHSFLLFASSTIWHRFLLHILYFMKKIYFNRITAQFHR